MTSGNFIFIGGAPRSGTTLVQKILGNHPSIYTRPEFDHIPDIISLYRKMRSSLTNNRQDSYYDEKILHESFKSFINDLILSKSGREFSYIAEKTPANILVFKELSRILPDSKFIGVVRDPRAVISSMKLVRQREQKLGRKKRRQSFNVLIELFRLRNYVDSFEAALNSEMKNISLVFYEDLVKEPEKIGRGICSFLNLEFLPAMIETDSTKREDKLVENDQVWYSEESYNRTISPDSISSWKTNLSNSERRLTERFMSDCPDFPWGRYKTKEVASNLVYFLDIFRHSPRGHFIKRLKKRI